MRLWARIREILFPPACSACGSLLDRPDFLSGKALCKACMQEWERQKNEPCEICAKPVRLCRCMTGDMEEYQCEAFCKLTYYMHGRREPVQNRLIYAIKQERTRRTVDFLARELVPSVQALLLEQRLLPENTVLTYVPRATAARLEYGTDQARELAAALARELSIPMLPLLERISGRGHAQKHLNSAERIKNAKKTYRVCDCKGAKGKTVLLVDDIVTSGATMASCSRLLKRAGARRIFAVAVASDDIQRVPKNKN